MVTLAIQASALGYPSSREIHEEAPSSDTHVALCPLTSNTMPSALSLGVVRQVRPIVGPFYAVLRLEMNYVLGGRGLPPECRQCAHLRL